MRKKQMVRVIIDDRYRLYIYKAKVALKKKNKSEWVPVFIGKFPSDVLFSSVINEDLKKKIEMKLKQIS